MADVILGDWTAAEPVWHVVVSCGDSRQPPTWEVAERLAERLPTVGATVRGGWGSWAGAVESSVSVWIQGPPIVRDAVLRILAELFPTEQLAHVERHEPAVAWTELDAFRE